MFKVEIDSSQFERSLRSLEQFPNRLGSAFSAIATEMLSITEGNFAAEGDPEWAGLADSTIAQRTLLGSWPGKILQVSAGGLAASVTAESGSTFARIGSAKVYAAIQQLGGQAGRGKKASIPARPYLPFTGTGEGGGKLQPAAEEAVTDIIMAELKKAAGVS